VDDSIDAMPAFTLSTPYAMTIEQTAAHDPVPADWRQLCRPAAPARRTGEPEVAR
jgi:hypothetical protein